MNVCIHRSFGRTYDEKVLVCDTWFLLSQKNIHVTSILENVWVSMEW